MIIAANKSSKEVIDDESRAFYEERFPIQCEVNWDTHTAQDYFKLLKLSFADSDTALLFSCPNCSKTIMLTTIRPLENRHRYYKVYINKGIDFIGNFSISTANIAQIKAAAARNITSNQYPSCSKKLAL
jgi:aspartate-semialdehyde dehydrogenase